MNDINIERINDFIVADNWYLHVSSDDIIGDVIKVPLLLLNGLTSIAYAVKINGVYIDMYESQPLADIKLAISDMYDVIDKNKHHRRFATIVLDYLYEELKLDHNLISRNLNYKMEFFMNQAQLGKPTLEQFNIGIDELRKFSILNDWLSCDVVDNLYKNMLITRDIENAIQNNLSYFINKQLKLK